MSVATSCPRPARNAPSMNRIVAPSIRMISGPKSDMVLDSTNITSPRSQAPHGNARFEALLRGLPHSIREAELPDLGSPAELENLVVVKYSHAAVPVPAPPA